jgi:hypothetical protein
VMNQRRQYHQHVIWQRFVKALDQDARLAA